MTVYILIRNWDFDMNEYSDHDDFVGVFKTEAEAKTCMYEYLKENVRLEKAGAFNILEKDI